MKKFSVILCSLGGVVVVAIAALVAYSTIPMTLTQMTTSMEPSITPGQTIKFRRSLKLSLDRGDVVAFEREGDLYMSRIAGLPGENIKYFGKFVAINGEVYAVESFQGLDRGEIPDRTDLTGKFTLINMWELGEEEYFLISDNAENAIDSRHFGPVKMSMIVGVAE